MAGGTRTYQPLHGRVYGHERNPQIAVRFERDAFEMIEKMARERNIAFGAIVRELVDVGLDWAAAYDAAAHRPPLGLSDDRDALASAGFVEGE